MTIAEALQAGITRLRGSGSAPPELDAELLLASVLRVERFMLFREPERAVSAQQHARFAKLVERRAKHEPIAYLVGYKEFYGREFFVDRSVLIPRPESELLIETCSNISTRFFDSFRIADIGTGSGCLAITLALELPNATMFATDIAEDALRVARRNAKRHGVTDRIMFLTGNLLEPLQGRGPFDVIIANLPYVPEKERTANPDLAYEPVLALSGTMGPERLYAGFMQQWNARSDRSVAVLEIHPAMRAFLEREAVRHDIAITFKQDLARKDRIAVLKKENGSLPLGQPAKPVRLCRKGLMAFLVPDGPTAFLPQRSAFREQLPPTRSRD